MKCKQVIVVRKDLNMRKGKIAAQVAHASMAVILDLIKDRKLSRSQSWLTDELYWSSPYEHVVQWLENDFTKICVSVDSEKELLTLLEAVKLEGIIPYSLITDSGATEFRGVPTNTCIAIGPWDSDSIDVFTEHLPLL